MSRTIRFTLAFLFMLAAIGSCVAVLPVQLP